ncbi:hypothetical protein C8R43DRAFT_944126 [Mycena crocata]|nr:hypothetical protein C8R43DRAFT_944126 [Mycena crocata]
MKLDDPEYAPVYYKVMVLDQSGTAEKCVKPPAIGREERPRTWIKSGSTSQTAPNESPNPATYPNNISLGKPTEPFRGCYGCLEEGHRISDCEKVQQLIEKNIMAYNSETRRLTMKNGRYIRRNPGESLVKAAERIMAAATSAPRVMLGFLDAREDRPKAVQNFYQEESRRARIEEIHSNNSSTSEMNSSSDESDDVEVGETALLLDRVYFNRSRMEEVGGSLVQPVERTEASTRKARREVLDGVYPPSREKTTRKVKDLEDVAGDADKRSDRLVPNFGKSPTVTHPVNREVVGKTPADSGKQRLKSTGILPELIPVEARKVRFEESSDIEMKEAKTSKKNAGKEAGEKLKEVTNLPDNTTLARVSGRQSELSATVQRQDVMNRILDTQVPLSIREIMVTSKDLRSDFQDLIKVKNVKAVLLGNSEDHHAVLAHVDWPRIDGILIKVEMETNGRIVCAIIDTGSQLDVITNMNDANGGKGQLQGWIRDVEFNCGGAVTVADLWVSQKAPFELLLGRPWQRGNMTTYLCRMFNPKMVL